MFGKNQSEENLSKAAEIKYFHSPERLYKYRTFSDEHISALKSDVLYITSTPLLNDIKEANLVITSKAKSVFLQKVYHDIQSQHNLPFRTISNSFDIIDAINIYFRENSGRKTDKDFTKTEECKAIIDLMVLYYKQQTEELQKEIRSMYSVCCLSATNDSNLMWAHYADSHRGFCIEYDFKSFGENNLLNKHLFPMIYKIDNRIMIDDIDQINGNIGMLAALQKESTWGYEQEWRLLYPGKLSGTPQPMPKPTAIYIGERAEADKQQIIQAYCQTNQIPMYKMRYDQTEDRIFAQKVLI